MKPQPEDPITILNPAYEPASVLPALSADRLMSIIRQAEAGDTRELFALYRDVVASDNQILTEFTKRKAAILGDGATVVPWDKRNPADLATKDLCFVITDSTAFVNMVSWLLNATLYPVAVVEKVYATTATGYTLKDIVSVPYQLLDYSSGALRIFDTDANGRPLSTSHVPDPARYIVHRGHLMPTPDNWGGPMRALLFWWLLRTMSRQWWADFIERFGVPFMVGKFDVGDDAGRGVLTRAFQTAVRLGAIVINKKTEVEIIQAATGDTSNSHERFIELCNREISKLIVGQTLSGQAQPTGELGGGTANLQGEVREDLRKMDAKMLAATIRGGLFQQLCQINALPGKTPLILFGTDSAAELNAAMNVVAKLGAAGFEPDDDGLDALGERVGFTIRRKASPSPSPFGGLSALPLNAPADPVEAKHTDKLAAALGERYKELQALITASTSPEDCIRRVRAWAEGNGRNDSAELLEQALTVYAYNGTQQKA